MRDKLSVLSNEQAILKNEAASKEKLQRTATQQSTNALHERDGLKHELLKLGSVYRGRQDLLEEQARGGARCPRGLGGWRGFQRVC